MPSKLKNEERKNVPVQRCILTLLQKRYILEEEISKLAEKWGTKALILRRTLKRLLYSGKVLEDQERGRIFYKLPVDALLPAQEAGGATDIEVPPEPPMGPTVEELMKVIFSLNQILEMSLRGLQISYDEITALQNRLNGEIRHRIDLQFFKDENVEHHRHKDQIDKITNRQENRKKLIEWWMRENASIGQSVRIENM